MNKITISIKNLFRGLGIDNQRHDDLQTTSELIYIKTPDNELTPVLGFVKKSKNKIYNVCLESGISFKCSENHLVVSEDRPTKVKYANTALTMNGYERITDKKFTEEGDVYDVCLEAPHLYVTPNGVVHHNTSLARILINDVLDAEYLFVQVSDQGSVDMIRTKVMGFARTKSFNGKMKVILLDECLHENTLVTVLREGTEQQVKIKDVDDLSDLVKSFNFVKDRTEWRPFYKVDKGEQEVYEVEFDNGEVVICTADHKWYVKDPSTGKPTRKKLIDIFNEGIREILSLNS